MVKNHLIRAVPLLMLLSTGVDAIKPKDPRYLKPIPPRGSAVPFGGTCIKGDGNCFYRSLSHYMFGSQEHHAYIRQAVINFMTDRGDRYAHLIDNRNGDYAIYLSNHRQDGVWAEDAIVQAAADVYGLNIYVTSYGRHGEILQVVRARSEQNLPSGQNPQRWLHLRLQGNHFDIINDYSEEGASEPPCRYELLSIQDPQEIETSYEHGLDNLEVKRTGVPESGGSKVIPDDELPEIKEPPKEEDTDKISDDKIKVIPEDEWVERRVHPMEEEMSLNFPSNTVISDEKLMERMESPPEDAVDNICSGLKVFKISEEEKDFEDQQQKKRIRNSVYQLELQLTENNLIENERDLSSGSRTTQTTGLRTVENLGTLENLFIDLEGEETEEETEPLEISSDVNEIFRSDSENSIENQTEVPLGKKPDDNLQIDNMDHLRELIQNGQVGFGSHFRVQRRLGFYEYFHHFLTLEANRQSMTVVHLTITRPLNIFCEKAQVDFSKFNNSFLDFKRGVELMSWYVIPTNETTLQAINYRLEEVIALGYINYSLTSPNKMNCASLVSYILTGERDCREVHDFVKRYGIFGIFLVLFVNCSCCIISNVRGLKNSVSKLKGKLAHKIQLVKSSILDRIYSFFSCLCCIWNSAANYLDKCIEKNFKKSKRNDKKGG